MNALATVDDVLQAVSRISTPDDVKEFINRLDTLKKMLDAADMFCEMACKYAMLEAAAYVRIAEMGLTSSVPTNNNRRKVVEWLADMSPDERDEVVGQCGAEGITIRAYWKTCVHEPEMEKRAIAAYCSDAGYAVKEFQEKGIVNLNDYLEIRNEPNKKRIPEIVKKGVKDKVRDRIRDLGGHGVGDGSGVYVNVDNAMGYADKLIETKLRSIRLDMERLIRTLRELEDIGCFKIDLPIKRRCTNGYELGDDGAINVAMALLGFGKPEFICSDEAASKIMAWMCQKLGWPVNRIRQVIIDEFEDSGHMCSNTGMFMIGMARDFETDEWSESRWESR